MLELLILLPLCSGFAMLVIQHTLLRRWLLIGTGAVHTLIAGCLVAQLNSGATPLAFGGLLAPDALGGLFLMLSSMLFFAAVFYAFGYLQEEDGQLERHDLQDGQTFTNAPERRFTACMCLFLAAMSLVTTTAHLGALWVGIELTTLASAPLIYFHRHQRSLEATWKYLMICSVGIALALIGNILLEVAFHGTHVSGMNQIQGFIHLAKKVGANQIPWLKAGFIFFMVGYGTKMGLAPLHNWLPDAHSEAPSMVSALLSGALLNCAFLGILRGHQILMAAGLGPFSGKLLIFFGLVSLFIAMIFIVGQGHYKRLLAYSSVEHVGILALGVGIGGLAASGALLHAICHSLTKCALFLLAGNILTRYHTLSSYDVRGMRWTMPLTSALWTAGFLAIVGSPPFGLFVTELTIAKGILASSSPWILAPYLGMLGIIFVGMSIPVLRMVQGSRPKDVPASPSESVFRILPSMLFLALVLSLGLYIPSWLLDFLARGASLIGGFHAF